VQQLAGGASFERGEIYAAEGRVRSLVMHGDALTATVRGSEDYAVRLAVKDDALAHACSCPVGADGGFCKHCVATASGEMKPSRNRRFENRYSSGRSSSPFRKETSSSGWVDLLPP